MASRPWEIEEVRATVAAVASSSGADPHAAIGTYGGSVLPKLERKAVKWTNVA